MRSSTEGEGTSQPLIEPKSLPQTPVSSVTGGQTPQDGSLVEIPPQSSPDPSPVIQDAGEGSASISAGLLDEGPLQPPTEPKSLPQTTVSPITEGPTPQDGSLVEVPPRSSPDPSPVIRDTGEGPAGIMKGSLSPFKPRELPLGGEKTSRSLIGASYPPQNLLSSVAEDPLAQDRPVTGAPSQSTRSRPDKKASSVKRRGFFTRVWDSVRGGLCR